MNRKLIINADDFGMCHSYNQAVFNLLEEERISTSTLMPVAPGREEAAEWCVRRNAKNIGLHTTFTSEWTSWRWKSLTGLSSLHDEDGFMPRGVVGFWERVQESEAALDARVSKVEPTLVLVTSLLVGLILLAVMLPLMHIMTAIG